MHALAGRDPFGSYIGMDFDYIVPYSKRHPSAIKKMSKLCACLCYTFITLSCSNI